MSLTWPLGRLWERERVSGIRWGSEWEMRWKLWNFGIIEKMSEIQVFRNDPKILPKIKNKI